MQHFSQLKSAFELSSELPLNFPKEVLSETAKFSKDSFGKEKNREDFRHLHVLCIDPVGARDHDDAISVEETKSGYILGVHIADISHFVKSGSALDKEAQKRAFTQYMPWASYPMLPEILSADLCSLREGENRFSFSCIISLDKKCRVNKYRFAKTLIKVSRSISYEQAMKLFEKKDKHICLLSRVAESLKKNRKENGFLEIDTSEYQCEFSNKGLPLRISQRKSGKSNSWVEECMLAANKCCALELQKRKLNGIYRIHEAPNPKDVRDLMQNEPNLFHSSPINASKLLKNYVGGNSQDKKVFELYSHLVKKANGNPLLTSRVLKSLQKAQYSYECTGHFALHWKDYAHFTSPIRRYADLWCHRELSKSSTGSSKILESLNSKLNEMEVKCQKTERKALKLCASYLLQNQIGQAFKGEIQGIEEFGVFISVSSDTVAIADGLVHLRDIPGDYYIYNESKKLLFGKRSGKTFKIGDKVNVTLIKVNPAKGENDFKITPLSTQKQKTPRKWRKQHFQAEFPPASRPSGQTALRLSSKFVKDKSKPHEEV